MARICTEIKHPEFGDVFLSKLFSLLIVLACVSASLAIAQDRSSATLPAFGETSVPVGWIQFCESHPEECRESDGTTQPVQVDIPMMRQITEINSYVNGSVFQVTDQEHYNRVDVWDYPNDGRGDCEDLALLKRKLLIHAGFPKESISIAVVYKGREGHAVLVVKTSTGDYVLDILKDDVIIWSRTGYKFKKYQSWQNPNIWISADANPRRLDEWRPSNVLTSE